MQVRAASTVFKFEDEVALPKMIEPMSVAAGRSPKVVKDPSEAFAELADGANVFVHTAAATPTPLLNGFAKTVEERKLRGMNVSVHGHAFTSKRRGTLAVAGGLWHLCCTRRC